MVISAALFQCNACCTNKLNYQVSIFYAFNTDRLLAGLVENTNNIN